MLLVLFALFFLVFGGHFVAAIFGGFFFHPISFLVQVAVLIVLVHLGRKLIDKYITK